MEHQAEQVLAGRRATEHSRKPFEGVAVLTAFSSASALAIQFLARWLNFVHFSGRPVLDILWCVAAAGSAYGYVGPFRSLLGDFLAGAAAAAGMALVTSLGSLGGFVGPSIMGTAAGGSGGTYRGLVIAGVSSVVSAALTLLLARKAVNS